MAKFIQIHTLTSHSANNLNRDDLGTPKTVTFMDRQHGRISSQCLKKSIRDTIAKGELEGKTASRTRKLPKMVKEFLQENGVTEKAVTAMVTEIAGLGKKGAAKAGDEETQLIFLTSAEIQQIKEDALTICQENEGKKLPDMKKEFKKKIQELYKEKKFQDGVDIAMFGRMTTSEVFENCDASIQVAHAITTHPTKNQDDFFTAVDDFSTGEETGSAHMDEKQFNTGIFYKYGTINVDQLKQNLADDSEITRKSIIEFLNAFVISLPTGSQNSMAAHQHPFSIFVTIGNGSNTNLSNAFAEPPKHKNGNLTATVEALLQEYNTEEEFYGSLKENSHKLFACKGNIKIDKKFMDGKNLLGSVPKLINEVDKILSEEL